MHVQYLATYIVHGCYNLYDYIPSSEVAIYFSVNCGITIGNLLQSTCMS